MKEAAGDAGPVPLRAPCLNGSAALIEMAGLGTSPNHVGA